VRAFPVLPGSEPWTWVIELPVSRETSVSLEIRAPDTGWPFEVLTARPIGRP
jgi:hypothetical protein